MLETAKLDGVTIATPPADHAELAIACLDRGLHVLCEKPLALTTWDALSMLQAASRDTAHDCCSRPSSGTCPELRDGARADRRRQARRPGRVRGELLQPRRHVASAGTRSAARRRRRDHRQRLPRVRHHVVPVRLGDARAGEPAQAAAADRRRGRRDDPGARRRRRHRQGRRQLEPVDRRATAT